MPTSYCVRTLSDSAIGSVLVQKQMFEAGLVERPLGYFSRKLHAVESRDPAYDSELHAISSNLEHWTWYVHRRKRTTVYMNHTVLQHILGLSRLTSRQWCHLDRLQQHDHEVKYFPGAANVVADALSRIAYMQEEQPTATPDRLNVIEMGISASTEWLDDVRNGYGEDILSRRRSQRSI